MTTKSYVEFLEDFLTRYKRYRSRSGSRYLCLTLEYEMLGYPTAFSHHKRLQQTISRKLKRLNQMLGTTILHPELTLDRELGCDKEGRIRFLENLIKRNKYTKVNN